MIRLLPYPSGWYVVGFSSELGAGGVLSRPFMGEDLVVYRTSSGRARAVDPFCPHLGAHLRVGGRVEGELIVCPFHGFAYDADGTCVRTGYGTKPPPTARLPHEPFPTETASCSSTTAACRSRKCRSSSWRIGRGRVGGRSRSGIIRRRRPRTASTSAISPTSTTAIRRCCASPSSTGPFLSTAFTAEHPLPVLRRKFLRFEFETEIFGLSYSLVNVRLPARDMDMRLWVLPTPINEERLTLRLAVSVRRRKRGFPYALLTRLMLNGLIRDATQDFPIWENKRYLARPALAEGDGPIGRYRRWAQQFYPDTAADGGGGGRPSVQGVTAT